jgi:hypothetical protein
VLPYIGPEVWKAFPNPRAADFARFVGLAKRGAIKGGMIVADVPGMHRRELNANARAADI